MVGVIRSKHRKRKLNAEAVKAGKNIKVNKRGLEDFNDYLSRSDIDPEDAPKVSNDGKTSSSYTKRNEDKQYSNKTQIPNNEKVPANNTKPNRPKHRRRPNEEEVKKGKTIRLDKRGREIFADYFSKSDIERSDNSRGEYQNGIIAENDNVNHHLYSGNSSSVSKNKLKRKISPPVENDKVELDSESNLTKTPNGDIVNIKDIDNSRELTLLKKKQIDQSESHNENEVLSSEPPKTTPADINKSRSPKTQIFTLETNTPSTSPCRVAIRDLCSDKKFFEAAQNCSVCILENLDSGNAVKSVSATSDHHEDVPKPKDRSSQLNKKNLKESQESMKIHGNETLNPKADVARETRNETQSRKGSSRLKRGGKHFLEKSNLNKRSKRSQNRDTPLYAIDTDTDSEASESDGHIYITKSPLPNNKTLDLPSTSGWKPPKEKRSIKSKALKQAQPKPEQISPDKDCSKETTQKPMKKLSVILETDEIITKSINLKTSPDILTPKFKPVVSIKRLDLSKLESKNEKSLRSSLKGSRKQKGRLSVSFKDPEFHEDEMENSILLNDPECNEDEMENSILLNDPKCNEDEMEKSSSGRFENSRFIPLRTPEIKTPNLRRSTRKRVPRLDAGLNQRIIYKRRASGLSVVGIDLGCTNEEKKIRRRIPQPKKCPPRDLDRSLSTHHRSLMLNDENADYSRLVIYDPINQMEIPYNMFTMPESLIWYGPNDEKAGVFEENILAKDDDPFVFAKEFQSDTFSTGVLKIRANSEKPRSQLEDDRSLMFKVIYGNVLLGIHTSKIVMKTGASFIIPEGNSYVITNLRADEALLHFYAT